PALTHAQNIHVLLYAIPGRQDTAHCDGGCDASVRDFSKATPVNWRCRAGPGLRKAAHGCAAAASQPWVRADACAALPRVRANARRAAPGRTAKRADRAG